MTGNGLKPIVFLLLLFAVPSPAVASGDVMLGRKGGTPLSWNPVTEYPLSDHVHFRVDVPQNAESAEFTVTHPDGTVEHPAGTSCMFGSQRAFMTGLQFTGCCLDAEWEVKCVVHCGQCGDLTFGPTTFDVQNLTLVEQFLSEVEPAGYATVSMPFAGVVTTLTSAMLGTVIDDGYEVLPPGADPQVWVIDATVGMVPIADGDSVSVQLSSDVDGRASMAQLVQGVVRGLYYLHANAQERMLSAPSGGPDHACSLSSTLSIDQFSSRGFVATAPRTGFWTLDVWTSAGDPWERPTAGTYTVWGPIGMEVPVGASIAVPTTPVGYVETEDHRYSLAGDFTLAVSYQDAGGSPHSGAPKWCVPGTLEFKVRASAHFVGPVFFDGEGMCSRAYEALGEVLQPGTPTRHCFYSGVPEVGVRGGVVPCSSSSLANLETALQQDSVIEIVADGAHKPLGPVGAPVIGGAMLGVAYPGDYLWADTVAGWTARTDKALLCYLVVCNGLEDTLWVDPYNPSETYPVSGPSLGQAIADTCAQAVLGWNGVAEASGAEAFDELFWEYTTEQDMAFQSALAAALDTLVSSHNPQWMIDHCLWEPSQAPRVQITGDGGLHFAYQMETGGGPP